jgi:hypothetical protein
MVTFAYNLVGASVQKGEFQPRWSGRWKSKLARMVCDGSVSGHCAQNKHGGGHPFYQATPEPVKLGCFLDFSEAERETVGAVGMMLVTKDRIHAGGLSVGLFGDPATSSLVINEPTQCANLKNFLVHD